MVAAQELLLRCPDIRTQIDAISVRDILFAGPGVDDVEVDEKTGRVRVVIVNQDGGADVRRRLIHAGFPPADDEGDYLRESG